MMMTRRAFSLALLGSATAAALPACSTVSEGLPGPATQNPSLRAVDCHAHVFRHDLPMPDPRRAPSGYDATPESYLAVLAEHGMTRGVLVQPSFLGTDNQYLVGALIRYPSHFRGIAVVDPAIGESELRLLNTAGVVGIRLNLIGLPTPDFASAPWRTLLDRLKALNWQVEVHQEAGKLAPVLDPLLAAGLTVVVDHFGRPDPRLGVDDPGFRHLLATGASRQVWVKLSGAYRNSGSGADARPGRGEEIAREAVPLLKHHLGIDRLVWGSDWPHTLFESKVRFGAVRPLLDEWLPDPAERQRVLADNPTALFRFG